MSTFTINTGLIHGVQARTALAMIVAVFTMGLMTIGCKSDIAITPPDFSSRLVVTAHLSPQNYFEVAVTATVSPDSTQSEFIPEGVQVLITNLSSGDVLKLYRDDRNWIAPEAYPKAGSEYLVEVTAPDYAPVSAVTVIPEDIGDIDLEVKSFEIVQSASTPNKKNLSYELDLNLTPAQQSTGYLHVLFVQHTTLNTGSIQEPKYEERYYEITPEYPEEQGYVEHIQQGVMVDLSNISDPSSLHFTFRDYTIDQYEQLGNLYIEARVVSDSYYRYFVSLKRQLTARQDPFAQPIQVFTNVESGLGCFSAFQSSTYVLSFPE